MSISGLTTSYIPASLDGLNVIDADQIYIDGQLVNLTDYVPYQGANRTIDAGGQNIQTTHTATATNDVVNKGLLDTTISNLAISIAGSFLDKVSVTPQIVIGNVSYTAQLSADDLLVPATKKATLGSVLSIDANWQRSETDAGVITRQYFGSISSSMGIYEATSTQNFAILQCADLGTGTGKRMDITWNLNINETYNSSIQLFASSDGVTTNQYLGPSVSFTPSDPLYKVMTGTFVPQYRYLCVLCATSKPSGVQTVRWYGLDIDEQGVELTNVTMPSLTADRVAVFNGNKQLVSSGISTTTLGYIAHLSSDAQSQLNGKLNLSGSNANQNIVIGAYKVQSTATPSVDDDLTRKGYVDSGLALKASLAANQTFTGTNTFSSSLPIVLSGLTPSRVLQLSASAVVQASAVTITELGYVSGVTSAIQTQLNTLSGTFANYLPLTGGTLSGNLTVEGASGISLTNVATTNGFLSTRYYIGARGDNQDDAGTDNKYGPWYGLGESGIPDFTGVPCLAGYAGVALRTSTGILVMKDDGAVGIGTTNVIGRHNIAYQGGEDFQTLQNTNYAANQYINQRFMFGKNGASNASAYVQAFLTANDDTDLVFYVYDGGVTERLRIRGDGKIVATASVGIGTTTIDTELYVYGKAKFYNATIGAPANGINGGTGTRLILWPGGASACPYALGIDGDTLWYGTPATASHKWYNGTTNVMTLNTSGYLIRANYTPYIFTDMFVSRSGTSGSLAVCAGNESDNAILYLGTPFDPTVSTGSAYKCAIIADGNGSGIGWSTADLHFCVNGSNGGGTNDYTQSANLTHSRMVIKSNTGYVGIGTVSPSGMLDIYNSSSDYRTSLVVRTPWAGMLLDNTQVSGGRKWGIFSGGPSAGIGVGNLGIYDDTAGAYRFSINSSGEIKVDVRLSVGGINDSNGILNIRNPNGSNTHFGYSDGFNYIRGDTIHNNIFRCYATSYWGDWLRISNNNTGLYWEGLGRGIASPEIVGNSYGNIATYGTGRNNWSGYGLADRHCLMVNGNQWGIHDNIHSWIIRGDGFYDRKVYISGQAVLISRNWDIFMVHMNLENTGSGYFYVNQGAGYGIASDARIKRNIEEISPATSLAFIKGLKPSSFCMKNTCPMKQKTADGQDVEYEEAEFCCCAQEGFIAQNVLESAIQAGVSRHVCNHWYEYEEEMKKPVEEQTLTDKNTLGVNDRPILSHTVNAVKGLMEEIDVLTQRNKILETWARDQEAKMAKMEANIEKMASLLAQLISKQ